MGVVMTIVYYVCIVCDTLGVKDSGVVTTVYLTGNVIQLHIPGFCILGIQTWFVFLVVNVIRSWTHKDCCTQLHAQLKPLLLYADVASAVQDIDECMSRFVDSRRSFSQVTDACLAASTRVYPLESTPSSALSANLSLTQTGTSWNPLGSLRTSFLELKIWSEGKGTRLHSYEFRGSSHRGSI